MRVLAAFPGATTTTATDVNDAGQVVGQVLFPGEPARAFLWTTSTGRVTLLPAPKTAASVANAINDRGTAVGLISTAGSVVWNTRTGRRHTLDMHQAVSINNSGVVVGVKVKDLDGDFPQIWPVVWTPATSRLTALNPLAGDEIAWPTDINNAGTVIGRSYSLARDDNVIRPVLWNPGGAAPCRLATTSEVSFAAAINDRDEIIGTDEAIIDSTWRQRPVVWNGCSKRAARILPFDPNDLGIPTGINNHGQIVGSSRAGGLTWTLSQT